MTDTPCKPSSSVILSPLQDQILLARGLIIQRGDWALSTALHFSVSAGQILHVQGQNGAGKSTLLQMLAGLLPLPAPEMLFWGSVEPAEWPVLYIGHKAGLSPALTVRDNLLFLQHLNRSARPEIDLALQVVGLAGYEETPVSQLSSGQKRRVHLARLWLADADQPLWLLDEPLTALDQHMVDILCHRVSAFAAQGGRVILTSHQALSMVTDTLDLDELIIPPNDPVLPEYHDV